LKAMNDRPLTSPEKRQYLKSLDLLNANSDDQARLRRQKRTAKEAWTADQELAEEQRQMARPPQSLRDIFKISNRNRKKNKQKKKVCKHDDYD
jgi:hypothetical protein